MTPRSTVALWSALAMLLVAGSALAAAPPFGVERPVTALENGRNCGTPEPTAFEQAQVRDAAAAFLRRLGPTGPPRWADRSAWSGT